MHLNESLSQKFKKSSSEIGPNYGHSYTSEILSDEEEWDSDIESDIIHKEEDPIYPFDQEDSYSQVPYQREKVRKQAEAQKKEKKEAKKNQGNICLIHKIMLNRCSQEKTAHSPKNLLIMIGETPFLICKFSHLGGKDMLKKNTEHWKAIPVTSIEPAPNRQLCYNPHCKDKRPAISFFRAGGRDIDQKKW